MNKKTDVLNNVQLAELSSEELDMVSGGVPYADARDYGGTENQLQRILGTIAGEAALLQIASI